MSFIIIYYIRRWRPSLDLHNIHYTATISQIDLRTGGGKPKKQTIITTTIGPDQVVVAAHCLFIYDDDDEDDIIFDKHVHILPTSRINRSPIEIAVGWLLLLFRVSLPSRVYYSHIQYSRSAVVQTLTWR